MAVNLQHNFVLLASYYANTLKYIIEVTVMY